MSWGLTSKDSQNSIGLIAGTGDFPHLIAQEAQSLGQKIVLLGLKGYTDQRLETLVSESHYLELGELEKLVELIKKLKLKKVILAGGVPKKEIYNPKPLLDKTAKQLIGKISNKGDDHLLRGFQMFLKLRCGVSIVDSRIFLKNTLASKGVMTSRKPTDSQIKDLKFGFKIAKSIGKMDIGQTVIVRDGSVIAVEALEGTDEVIRRAGALCQEGGVIVKTSKPQQDLKFDLPCVGPNTLLSMKDSGIKILGIEAGKTIMLFKNKLIESADNDNIILVGL